MSTSVLTNFTPFLILLLIELALDDMHRFVQRGFSKCAADAIPERRRARINLARGSKYYLKYLHDSSPHLVGSTFGLLETSDLPQ